MGTLPSRTVLPETQSTNCWLSVTALSRSRMSSRVSALKATRRGCAVLDQAVGETMENTAPGTLLLTKFLVSLSRGSEASNGSEKLHSDRDFFRDMTEVDELRGDKRKVGCRLGQKFLLALLATVCVSRRLMTVPSLLISSRPTEMCDKSGDSHLFLSC